MNYLELIPFFILGFTLLKLPSGVWKETDASGVASLRSIRGYGNLIARILPHRPNEIMLISASSLFPQSNDPSNGKLYLSDNIADRDTITSQNTGDIAYVESEDQYYYWDGAAWQTQSKPETTAETVYIELLKDSGTALPQRSNLNAKGALEATDNDPDTDLDVKANGVDFSRMQDIDQDRLIGRTSAGTGDPEQLTMIQEWVAVPASSSDTGITGQKAQDGTDIFMCYTSNSWLRIKGDGSGIDFTF